MRTQGEGLRSGKNGKSLNSDLTWTVDDWSDADGLRRNNTQGLTGDVERELFRSDGLVILRDCLVI